MLALSRWSLNGLGGPLELDRVSSEIGAVTGYDPAFFDRPSSEPVLALVVVVLVMLCGAGVTLDRRIGRARRVGREQRTRLEPSSRARMAVRADCRDHPLLTSISCSAERAIGSRSLVRYGPACLPAATSRAKAHMSVTSWRVSSSAGSARCAERDGTGRTDRGDDLALEMHERDHRSIPCARRARRSVEAFDLTLERPPDVIG